MLFLEISSKKVFISTVPSMSVGLNQYRGKVGSFNNWSTGQITELAISLFNISVNFIENVSAYFILIVNIIF